MSDSHTDRLVRRWANELTDAARARTAGRVPLTGRCILASCNKNLRAHANAEGGILTVALCHSLVRQTARPGDVVVLCASGPNRAYGLNIPRQRCLITHIMVVESTMSHARYYGRIAPRWAAGRADRIYSMSVNGVETQRSRLCRNGQTHALRQLEDGSSNTVLRTCHATGRPPHTWSGMLRNGVQVTFALRCAHDVRFHRAGEIDHATRLRDFRGRILVGRSYKQVPGDIDHPQCIELASLTQVRPSIGFTNVPFGRGTRMRRFVEELFPDNPSNPDAR